MQAPLIVYVVWHPDFKEGQAYADFMYATFCRDVQYPLSRGIGIPVFFRSAAPAGEKFPKPVDFTESTKTAVIILLDDYMFDDNEWNPYINSLTRKQSDHIRLFPVAFSSFAFDMNLSLSETQFISLHTIIDTNTPGKELEERKQKLRSELLHDLSRLLLSIPASDDTYLGTPPIRIFISHAKKDGETYARQLRDYINSEFKLKTFFDANDIANGYSFEKVLRKGIEMTSSVLLIFQSDEYAAREWCRIEVIIAKRFKCPMVVINAVNKGEKRSFPYLGNVPTIRWNNNFNEAIDLALIQMLYNLYMKAHLRKIVEMYKIEEKWQVIELASPPELFNIIDIKKVVNKKTKKKCLVIYPDPPLGNEELSLLQDFDDKIQFITPVLIPALM